MLRSHLLQINLEMVLQGGFRLVVALMVLVAELGFGSRLEDMLKAVVDGSDKEDGADEREYEEGEAIDDGDEVEHNRSTNSTNESRYSNCSIGSNRYHFFAIFSSNVNGVSGIPSFEFKLPLAVCKAFDFSFSYLVKISRASWVQSIFESSGFWSSSSNKVSAARAWIWVRGKGATPIGKPRNAIFGLCSVLENGTKYRRSGKTPYEVLYKIDISGGGGMEGGIEG